MLFCVVATGSPFRWLSITTVQTRAKLRACRAKVARLRAAVCFVSTSRARLVIALFSTVARVFPTFHRCEFLRELCSMFSQRSCDESRTRDTQHTRSRLSLSYFVCVNIVILTKLRYLFVLVWCDISVLTVNDIEEGFLRPRLWMSISLVHFSDILFCANHMRMSRFFSFFFNRDFTLAHVLLCFVLGSTETVLGPEDEFIIISTDGVRDYGSWLCSQTERVFECWYVEILR